MTDAEDQNPTPPGTVHLQPPEPDAHEDAVFGFAWMAEDGSVDAEGEIARGEGGLVVSDVHVHTQYSSGITHLILRAVPLGEILAAARSALAGGNEAIDAVPISVPRAKHTAMTDELLRDVARAYLEESAKGSGVVKRLQERFGRPQGTMITWINRSRKEGWLGPGTRGRIGAEPGPKLTAWIRQVISDSENTTREARRIAEEWGGVTPGVVSQALRAYNDIAERDISHNIGLPPLETAVAAQVLFGRPLSAELAERTERAGGSRQDALSVLLVEMHEAFAKTAERSFTKQAEARSGNS